MESIDKIPTSKLLRASHLVKTGAKVGINYLKYQGDKLTKEEGVARKKFEENNADAIYDSLKELKGSALKVAQMLSMDQNILPQAYVDKFSLSQFSVPPLSSALVNKTFKQYFGKLPNDVFDTFEPKATHAASIGQVHAATLGSKKLAVKIQYPGVADSISSDLAIVKPFALKLFNLKSKDSEIYFHEVEQKLLEETNYRLELKNGEEITRDCQSIQGLIFPKYYPEFSSDKFITMDWMDGIHLSEFTKKNQDKELANKIGQSLWDFYMHQIHVLKKVHADPHPGNFLIDEKTNLVALDFGCMKEIPAEFYNPYFSLVDPSSLNNPEIFDTKMRELEIIKSSDSDSEIKYLGAMFYDLLSTFTAPFQEEYFDFSNEIFFQKIATMAEAYSKDPEFKKIDGNRGSKHFIYMNRTFFGLYNLLHMLKATKVKTKNSWLG